MYILCQACEFHVYHKCNIERGLDTSCMSLIVKATHSFNTKCNVPFLVFFSVFEKKYLLLSSGTSVRPSVARGNNFGVL